MKKVFRCLHLWLGLASGIIVFVVAITGCFFAFEKEIKSTVYKNVLFTNVGTSALPIEDLLTLVKKEYKKSGIKNISISEDPSSCYQFNLKDKSSVYVDQYSGKIKGMIDHEHSFFGVVLHLHRDLLLGEPGKKITGVSALIFFIMIISGIVLWWPKGKFTTQKFSINHSASFKRLNHDLHSVLGFYASWILIFSSVTALVFSYKWFENGMYTLVGCKKERKQFYSVYSDPVSFSLDKSISYCKIRFPDHKEIFIALPEDSVGACRVNVRNNDGGLFKNQHQLFFDRYSGELINTQLFENTSRGDKLKAINYDIHTGKVLGFTGQLLVFFAALVAASLPITGFIMWWKKRKNKEIFFSE